VGVELISCKVGLFRCRMDRGLKLLTSDSRKKGLNFRIYDVSITAKVNRDTYKISTLHLKTSSIRDKTKIGNSH
jgi:hypothetical protein